MFAIIKTGGKQYRVEKDVELTVEKLAAEPGDAVQFNDVLMLGGEGGVTVGAPLVADAAVQAEVLDQTKGEKSIKFVKRRRKHSSARRRGHRQQFTVVKITEIIASGGGATGVRAADAAPEATAETEEA